MNNPSGSFPARCSLPAVERIERRLARWHATVKGAWARLAFRALPHLAGITLEMDAAALHPGPLARFFSTTVRQIGPIELPLVKQGFSADSRNTELDVSTEGR